MNRIKCLMLIDEDDSTNIWNHLLIERSGYTDKIVVARNVSDAMDYLSGCIAGQPGAEENDWPGLIFLDIDMPVMKGWEFLESYGNLASKYHQSSIVILLTTSVLPSDLVHAGAISCVAELINKPLTPAVFEKIYLSYFDAGKLRDESVD